MISDRRGTCKSCFDNHCTKLRRWKDAVDGTSPVLIGDNFREEFIDVASFCKRFNVPCDVPIIVEKEKILGFMEAVHKKRDQMTEEIFGQILRKLQLPGESLHAEVLGIFLRVV